MNIIFAGDKPMTPLFEGFMAKYGWILVGLSFGFLAKYALLLKRGVRVKLRLVVADILLLPMVALIAYWLASRTGFEGEAAALFAAFCTVGADRLVKLLTDRFLQRVDNEVRAIAEETIGRVRQEVQTVKSGQEIVTDTIEGRALSEYAALKPHPQTSKSG